MEIKSIENSEENPAIKRADDGYGDEVFYVVDISDPNDISPKLRKVIDSIAELEKEKNKLANQLAGKVSMPSGWKHKIRKIGSYGSIEVLVSKSIWREKPAPAATVPPKPKSKLEELMYLIDIKTLFNSGILTKEEKRELLGLKPAKTGNTADAAA